MAFRRAAVYSAVVFLLLIGMGFATNRSPLAPPAPFATCTPPPPEGFGTTLDISPEFILSGEVGQDADRGDITVAITGRCDEERGQYVTKVTIDVPIFIPNAPRPNDNWDTDDYEHIRVYFANDYKRILEIRFNRYRDQSMRLLRKPHSVLRDTEMPTFTSFVSSNNGKQRWNAEVEFVSDLLPAHLSKASVVVVDPRQREPSQRYITNYRIYNHPISLLDLHVVSSFEKVEKPDHIVPPGPNHIYSSWWDGLCPSADEDCNDDTP